MSQPICGPFHEAEFFKRGPWSLFEAELWSSYSDNDVVALDSHHPHIMTAARALVGDLLTESDMSLGLKREKKSKGGCCCLAPKKKKKRN